MSETWRAIPEWEGEYEVSDQGRVRSLPRRVDMVDGRRYTVAGKVRALWTDPKGYVHATLYRNDKGKRHAVHVLVAAAFIGPRPAGMQVCHNNGDPTDNRAANLRYDTNSGNQLDRRAHGTACWGERNNKAVLTDEAVRSIRRAYASGSVKQRELAVLYGTTQQTISRVVHGHVWRHVA